jgi:hypothetical protein
LGNKILAVTDYARGGAEPPAAEAERTYDKNNTSGKSVRC